MILEFEFNYISKNGFLENLLIALCEEFGINHKVGKLDSIITLKVEDTEEKLTQFSDFIGERLPISIFFKSTAVNVVDDMTVVDFEKNDFTLNLPFTPKVLTQSNPLMNNEVGSPTFNASGIKLNGITYNKNYDELYENIAQIIVSGKRLHVNSASGSYELGKIDENFKNSMKENFIVIPADLSVIEKMVVIRENEIKAIASLEKPTIRLKVNSLYDAKEILPSTRVKMKLADEMLLVKICEKLHKNGIDFLYRSSCESTSFENKVEIDGEFSLIPQVEICVLENGEILIIDGDGYSSSLLKANLKKFENPAHAQLASIMQEHSLFEEKVSCFYLSKKHNDMTMHISDKTGLMELTKFPIMRSFKEIYEEIEKSTAGSKLVKNYKENFPEAYEKSLHVKISEDTPDNIYSIWGIAAVILGMADNIEDGAEKLIVNAEDFGGKKGPRIDYLLNDKEAIQSDFNMLRLIRSTMSFKLAGTDDITLSFGVIESLAYFLSDTSDSCKENLSSQRTLLCGSMFGVRRLAEIACQNIVSGSKICLNRELPIDN